MLRPPAAVAVAVITSSPNPTGTVAENDPSDPAVTEVTVAVAPVVVSADAMSTCAPGAVVPVTVVVAESSVAPEVGAVRLTVSEPGGPWVM